MCMSLTDCLYSGVTMCNARCSFTIEACGSTSQPATAETSRLWATPILGAD